MNNMGKRVTRGRGTRRGSAKTRRGTATNEAVKRARPEVSPLLLTMDQVAASLAVSEYMVYRLVSSGRLASIKIGALRRVAVADLEQFVTTARGASA